MKRLPPLNEQQQQLVEKNLTVIHWAIHNFVKINETVFGFEYDDLYGEGCVLLCKAAATYDSEKGRFSAYAQTVVKNGLLSYCRIMCNRQNRRGRPDERLPHRRAGGGPPLCGERRHRRVLPV